MPDASFTPAGLAERWRCTAEHVLTLVHSGRLKAFTLSAPNSKRPRWRIPPEAVEAYENRNAARAPAPPQRRTRQTRNVIEFYK